MPRKCLLLLCPLLLASLALAYEAPPRFAHSHTWVMHRLGDMLACDDAYLYNEVLGGRAIHQNSFSKPPTEAWEGNFHTQQQSRFALLKMDLYELGKRQKPRLLDEARELLDWVMKNGYDRARGQFWLKYTTRTGEWEKGFYPEFNMITVAALLRYHYYRPTPEFQAAGEQVLARILATSHFQPNQSRDLYGAGYIALKLLDLFDATGEDRYLQAARKVTSLADELLWDEQYGGWFITRKPDRSLPQHPTKFTHINANLAQACLRLYLRGQGAAFRDRGVAALEFLGAHLRSPDGGWYRHTTRDGGDPTLPPGVGDGGTTQPGTYCVYDRMAQVMVACCLAYRATGERKYLRWVDETLDKMEKTHLTQYPIGVNYGYTGANDYQNTWCHQWGLQAMIEIARLQHDLPQAD